MKFGEILDALKQYPSLKACRAGWNGKDMFIWLKPETMVKSEWCKDPILKNLADKNGGEIQALGTLCMYCYSPNGQRAILSGWLASQTDMLADDWMIIDDNQSYR